MSDTTTVPDVLREGPAGEYIDTPAATLRQWRYLGKGPRYVKLPNGGVRYRRADLDEFLAASTVDPQGRER
jgi:hypothetical protein